MIVSILLVVLILFILILYSIPQHEDFANTHINDDEFMIKNDIDNNFDIANRLTHKILPKMKSINETLIKINTYFTNLQSNIDNINSFNDIDYNAKANISFAQITNIHNKYTNMIKDLNDAQMRLNMVNYHQAITMRKYLFDNDVSLSKHTILNDINNNINILDIFKKTSTNINKDMNKINDIENEMSVNLKKATDVQLEGELLIKDLKIYLGHGFDPMKQFRQNYKDYAKLQGTLYYYVSNNKFLYEQITRINQTMIRTKEKLNKHNLQENDVNKMITDANKMKTITDENINNIKELSDKLIEQLNILIELHKIHNDIHDIKKYCDDVVKDITKQLNDCQDGFTSMMKNAHEVRIIKEPSKIQLDKVMEMYISVNKQINDYLEKTTKNKNILTNKKKEAEIMHRIKTCKTKTCYTLVLAINTMITSIQEYIDRVDVYYNFGQKMLNDYKREEHIYKNYYEVSLFMAGKMETFDNRSLDANIQVNDEPLTKPISKVERCNKIYQAVNDLYNINAITSDDKMNYLKNIQAICVRNSV